MNPKGYRPIFCLPINFLNALPTLLTEEDNQNKLVKEVVELRKENATLKAKLRRLQEILKE